MARLHRDGLFEARVESLCSLDGGIDYRFEVESGDAAADVVRRPATASAGSSPTTTCTCSARARCSACTSGWARTRRRSAARAGVHFAVWAPNGAARHRGRRLQRAGTAACTRCGGWCRRGIWEIFIPDLGDGERYKFEIRTTGGHLLHKADPFGALLRSAAALGVDRLPHRGLRLGRRGVDGGARRLAPARSTRPMSIYEVHLGSWRPRARGRRIARSTYRELAEQLVPYVKEQGFTHIELLPVMEHPYRGSWGYQVTGFFAPTSRYGHPHDFKAFVDACHRAGIGVLLDWVPGHFPKDAHGLARFDGTALYEHEDPRQGEHQDWGTLIFNYGRNEVRNFLLSSALFWLQEYHLDGLRVDAVASMLYLDYSRTDGQWIPNRYGGRENLEAVSFLQQLNTLTHAEAPGSITAAEESTAWPGVSRPGAPRRPRLHLQVEHGLDARHAEVHRARSAVPQAGRTTRSRSRCSTPTPRTSSCRSRTTRSSTASDRCSTRCRATAWQKAAKLRVLFAFMYAHPGKKLLFMGDEFGQWREWNHEGSLDWDLLDRSSTHRACALVRAISTAFTRAEPALYERDFDPQRLPVDRLQRQREQRRLVPATRRRARRAPRGRVQLDAGAARGATASACPWPATWQVAEHRRRPLRRLGRGQRRRGRDRGDRRARVRSVAAALAAAARRDLVVQAGPRCLGDSALGTRTGPYALAYGSQHSCGTKSRRPRDEPSRPRDETSSWRWQNAA